MRRHRGLFNTVIEPRNLWGAWRDFRRGKRGRSSVLAFEVAADGEIFALNRELAGGGYRPAGYRLKLIHEPKRRLIAAAPVRDRVVHHALYRVLAPLMDPGLIDTTYACLQGRGSHRALLAFLRALRDYRYALNLDIRHYFLSIDLAILDSLMARCIKDASLLALLRNVAQSGDGLYRLPEVAAFLGLKPGFPPQGCGLPIGNLTSQWWGNHYLSGLDHFIKRELKIPHYQRYMDDLSLFSDSRQALTAAREAIVQWLWDQRHLRLKRPGSRPKATKGSFTYLGHHCTRAGISPSTQMLKRMERRVSALVSRGDEATIERSIAAYKGLLLT